MTISNFKFLQVDNLESKISSIDKKIKELKDLQFSLMLEKIQLIEKECEIEDQQFASASTSNNVMPSNSLLESIETGDLFSQV